MLELYHGSEMRVERPLLEKCRPNNDYGRGFYCTAHADLAREWACQKGIDGFCNEYCLDDARLNIVDLNAEPYTVLHWLSVLSENRIVSATAPTMVRGKAWLAERFHVDLSAADVVKGYRADDSYFGFARAFLRNEITLAQLERAMRLGELGEQCMLKSPAAFEALSFVGSELVDSKVYWPQRSRRDLDARAGFREIVAGPRADGEPRGGLYLATLMDMEEGGLHAVLR